MRTNVSERKRWSTPAISPPNASLICSFTTRHCTRCGMVDHPRSTPCYRSVPWTTGAWKSRCTSWLRSGAKCILLGNIGPHDLNDHRLCGTFLVHDLATGAITWRQAVTWHPAPGAGGDIPLAGATWGEINGDENHSPLLKEHAIRMVTLNADWSRELPTGRAHYLSRG